MPLCYTTVLFAPFFPNILILGNAFVFHVNRDFTMWRLWSTITDKYATAHDQYYVTVHFSCVVPGLSWVVEMFRVVATAENILLLFCPFRLSLGPYYRNNEKLFGERSVKCAYFSIFSHYTGVWNFVKCYISNSKRILAGKLITDNGEPSVFSLWLFT